MKENLIPVKRSLFAMILLAMALLLPATGNCFTAMAQVDKTRIAPEDRVSLQVVVEGGQAEVDLSAIQDFKIVQSGSSTSRSYTNGQWQHQVIYRYQLVPIKTGVLKIPPLKITQKTCKITGVISIFFKGFSGKMRTNILKVLGIYFLSSFLLFILSWFLSLIFMYKRNIQRRILENNMSCIKLRNHSFSLFSSIIARPGLTLGNARENSIVMKL